MGWAPLHEPVLGCHGHRHLLLQECPSMGRGHKNSLGSIEGHSKGKAWSWKDLREKQGISCGIVTGRDIPRTLSNSLRWLHGGVPTKGLVPSAAMRQDLLDSFFKLFRDYAIPFRQIIHIVEEHTSFSPGRWLRSSSIRSSRDEP